MKKLLDSFKKYENPNGGSGDKGSLHSYIDSYENIFQKISNIKLLEIGCARGDSVMMWADYFDNSEIIAVDIYKNYIYPEVGWKFIHHNACTKEFSDTFENEYFDYIIDDGSHTLNDQLISFEFLFKKLKNKGKYVIEDVQNIDKDKQHFLNLYKNVKIIDLRHERPLPDNVMILIEKDE
jgi:ubiquinone/menaquinone biosynthesis C-methylase UbiE